MKIHKRLRIGCIIILASITLLSVFSFAVGVYAASTGSNNDDGVLQIFDQDKTDELSQNAGFGEKIASEIVVAIPNWIMEALHLKDMVTLVYGVDVQYSNQQKTSSGFFANDKLYDYINNLIIQQNGGTKSADYINQHNLPMNISYSSTNYVVDKAYEGVFQKTYFVREVIESKADPNNVYGIFPSKVYELILFLKSKFEQLVAICLLLAIVISGLLLLMKPTSASMQYAKDIASGILMALLMLKFAVTIFEIISSLNTWGVNYMYEALGNKNNLSFLELLWQPNTKSLGMAVVCFISVFLVASMNFQYAQRMLLLGILFMMAPWVAVMSVIPQKKPVLNMWASEVASNIFTQLAHSIALTLFIGIIYAVSGSPFAFWITMAALTSMNAITTLIRSMLGLPTLNNKTATGFAGNLMGVGALLGTARLASALMGKKGAASRMNAAVGGNPTSNSVEVSSNSTSSNATAKKSLTPGADFLRGGIKSGITATARSGAGLVAGLGGGMIMAASGEDPTAGLVLGAMAGSKIGGIGGKSVGYALNRGHALKNTILNDKSLKQNLKDSAGFYDSSQMSSIQEMMNMGRNLGTSVLGGKHGGKLGEIVGAGAARINQLKGQKAQDKISDLDINDRTDISNSNNKTFNRAVNYETAAQFNDHMGNLRSNDIKYKQESETLKNKYEADHAMAEYSKAEYGKDSEEYKESYYAAVQSKTEYQESFAQYKLNKFDVMRMQDQEKASQKLSELRSNIKENYIRTGNFYNSNRRDDF